MKLNIIAIFTIYFTKNKSSFFSYNGRGDKMETNTILPIGQNKELKEKVQKFLNEIDTLNNLDIDLLENGVCIYENDEIIGYITFEKYCEYGLIRYFIFQKKIDIQKVFQMFHQLVDVARAKLMIALIAIGKNDEVINLFEMLGFYKIDPYNLVVNNQTIEKTELEGATILKFDVEKEEPQ